MSHEHEELREPPVRDRPERRIVRYRGELWVSKDHYEHVLAENQKLRARIAMMHE